MLSLPYGFKALGYERTLLSNVLYFLNSDRVIAGIGKTITNTKTVGTMERLIFGNADFISWNRGNSNSHALFIFT